MADVGSLQLWRSRWQDQAGGLHPLRAVYRAVMVCCATLQDVTEVVDTCHEAGISKKTVKLRPIAVVKG